MKQLVLAVTALATALATFPAGAAEFEARDAFAITLEGNLVLLQAAPGDVIVFREADNDLYVLGGRNLLVSAERVRLVGDVVVRSFARGSTAPLLPDEQLVAPPGDNGAAGLRGSNVVRPDCGKPSHHGCDGEPGARGHPGFTGTPGAPAGKIELAVEILEGDGRLTLLNVGQSGGPGGKGGRGGDGGPGGDGNRRHCAIVDQFKNPAGNGGTGGDAGMGGLGGSGGQGGKGGDIVLAATLVPAVLAGRLRLFVEGGLPGPRGPQGEPGRPGTGGAAGKGNRWCGGGGDPGKSGAKAPTYFSPVYPGDHGEPGAIWCAGCKPLAIPEPEHEDEQLLLNAGMSALGRLLVPLTATQEMQFCEGCVRRAPTTFWRSQPGMPIALSTPVAALPKFAGIVSANNDACVELEVQAIRTIRLFRFSFLGLDGRFRVPVGSAVKHDICGPTAWIDLAPSHDWPADAQRASVELHPKGGQSFILVGEQADDIAIVRELACLLDGICAP